MSSSTENNSQRPELQENLDLLQGLPHFATFPPRALKLLAFLAERATFTKGDVLFERGDDSGRAYLLLSGQLDLLLNTREEDQRIDHFTEGEFLGGFSLLTAMPALFTLIAAQPSRVLCIDRQQFSKILEQFPETGKIFLQALLKELYQWERRNCSREENLSPPYNLGATAL
jgi:CRP/FNR family transcriptional regulator, cyclic AMP receptor protein